MNRTATILSSLALLGVIILFVLHFRSSTPAGAGNRPATAAGTAPANGGMRMAYVDIDTFEAHYESLKKKKDEFKAQQQSMESELQRSAGQMQADYESVMRKQQAGTLTQAEEQSAQKRIGQMQQSLESRKQAMATQFQEKLESFNTDLHTQMDAFLEKYVRDHHFDYVLSYSRSNAVILYADKGLNITQDVIKGMNEQATTGGEPKSSGKGK